MKLTYQAIRNAEPKPKQYQLSDGNGLALLVTPTGNKWWRFRYYYRKKASMLSLGVYPEVSLKAARQKAAEMRELLTRDIDPSDQRKQERLSHEQEIHTFAGLARRWYEDKHVKEVVPTHALRNWRRLERLAFPLLGDRTARSITPSRVLPVLQRVIAQGHIETAHRLKSLIGQVMRYGIILEVADRDPSADLRDALPPNPTKHYASITDPADIPPLLRALDVYAGEPTTRAALRLAPMLLVRPGELRKAEWAQINWERQEWTTIAKGNVNHLVPLPHQAVDTLKELLAITRHSPYVFASPRSRARPMSNNSVNAALARLGYKGIITGHGFRAMARTILVERLDFPVEIVEMQLAHRVRDIHGRAYNRAQWLDKRRAMMQTWADYLDELRNQTPVLHAD